MEKGKYMALAEDGENFECPYCEHSIVVSSDTKFSVCSDVEIQPKRTLSGKKLELISEIIVCPNQNCKQTVVATRLVQYTGERHQDSLGYTHITRNYAIIKEWNMPDSKAKPQPNYIPKALIRDYEEACGILKLSPKASATLSRRCLQGILRDFHKVSEATLYKEIDALKDVIPDDEWSAISGLREIGNIGAHMEKDINVIVDVDENEAEHLIWLIEYLFKEWYVRRYEKEEKLKTITDIASKKRAQKTTVKSGK
jgi:hypothetical protein